MITIDSMEITPLEILLKDDFDNMGYDDDTDIEYDDYPTGGALEICREF